MATESTVTAVHVPAGTKCIDVISKKLPDGKPHVSLEYFPPRTEEGVTVRRSRDWRLHRRLLKTDAELGLSKTK
jgi:hypothetical protein